MEILERLRDQQSLPADVEIPRPSSTSTMTPSTRMTPSTSKGRGAPRTSGIAHDRRLDPKGEVAVVLRVVQALPGKLQQRLVANAELHSQAVPTLAYDGLAACVRPTHRPLEDGVEELGAQLLDDRDRHVAWAPWS